MSESEITAQLRKAVTFIDQFAFEPKLYWRLPCSPSKHQSLNFIKNSQDHMPEVEIRWQLQLDNNNWGIRFNSASAPTGKWLQLSGDEFLKQLDADGSELAAINRESLAKNLLGSIITQLSFAKMMTAAAVEEFGSDFVNNHLSQSEAFFNDILIKTQDMFKEEDGESIPNKQRGKTHLNLIKK